MTYQQFQENKQKQINEITRKQSEIITKATGANILGAFAKVKMLEAQKHIVLSLPWMDPEKHKEGGIAFIKETGKEEVVVVLPSRRSGKTFLLQQWKKEKGCL